MVAVDREGGIRIVQFNAWAWNDEILTTHPELLTGLFGDGIIVMPAIYPSVATIFDNSILDPARAGVSNFGSQADLTNNLIWCAGFDLNGEHLVPGELGPLKPLDPLSYSFNDGGGNLCGCEGVQTEGCVAQSSALAPPSEEVAP